jgi:exodeoxyribonuclease VII small subunit
MATSKKQNYSEMLQELDDILKHLDKEDIALEELSPLVKRAAAIIQKCKAQLFETDAEIQQMLDALEAQ